MPSTIYIEESLAVAGAALRPITPLPPVPDPLRLNMPPLGYPGTGSQPDAASLRVLGALYLYAELEQAGLIPVAEVMAQNRATLPVQDLAGAGKLESFARAMQNWYDRQHRGTLFARLFGLGEAATNDQGVLVNRDFERALAAFCLAIVAYAGNGPFTVRSGYESAHLATSAVDLLSNLGGRQFGNTLFAARSIHDELLHAIDLLNDRGIQSAFQAHDMWNLLAKVIGDGAPDFGRLVHRGQTGQRLMEWLASALAQLSGVSSPPVPPTVAVTWAAEWLDANGLMPGAGAAA
jgi:hypothetical protein